MSKGSREFSTSHSKPDSEEVKKASKASTEISAPQAQFPKVLNKAETAKDWQRK